MEEGWFSGEGLPSPFGEKKKRREMMNMMYYVLLLVTSMLWAANFVAGKYLIDHASPLTLTDIRWGISILLLLPFVWFQERKIVPPKKALLSLFFMGVTGVVFFNVFMFLALERTTANNVGLLSALNPIAIALSSYFLLKEKLTDIKIVGMTLSFIGVLVVISNGQWDRILQFRLNTGDLFMMAAVASWGLYSVAGRKAMQYTSPFMSTLWSGIFGMIIMLPFNLPSFSIHQPDLSFWIAVMYVSVGATVLAMVFWNIGVQRVGGTKAGMFLNFNPIFTALFAFLLLGEQMTVVQMVGTGVVICGILLFSLQRKRPNSFTPVKDKHAS